MSELHIYIAYKVIALEISNKTAELCMIFYLKHEFFIFLMYFKISYDFTIRFYDSSLFCIFRAVSKIRF
jgi:hypothetical protein